MVDIATALQQAGQQRFGSLGQQPMFEVQQAPEPPGAMPTFRQLGIGALSQAQQPMPGGKGQVAAPGAPRFPGLGSLSAASQIGSMGRGGIPTVAPPPQPAKVPWGTTNPDTSNTNGPGTGGVSGTATVTYKAPQGSSGYTGDVIYYSDGSRYSVKDDKWI